MPAGDWCGTFGGLETERVPFEASTLVGGQRVLVLAPHPDDEIIGCGGALALHSDAGDEITVVILTSGELGGKGEPSLLAARREAEAVSAANALGAPYAPRFLRLPDRGVKADGALVGALRSLMAELVPTLVYAPSPLEMHPDHRAVAHALRLALAGQPSPPRIALFEVCPPTPINVLVDIDAVADRKWAALAAHESQTEGAVDFGSAVRGLAAFRALTLGATRAAEGFRLVPGEALEEDLSFTWARLWNPPPAPKTARVSVIVRTRDRPTLLRRALQSLQDQTYRDFEVVLVNDGGASVSDLIAEFPDLSVTSVVHRQPLGRAAASNAGVAAAKGTYVAFLDDDDFFLPSHLETLLGFLLTHPDVAGAYTEAELREVGRGPTGEVQLLQLGRPFSGSFEPDRLLYENYIPNLCIVLQRAWWERVGGCDPELRVFEDWDFLMRLGRMTRLHSIPQVTCVYERRKDGSHSVGEGAASAGEEDDALARIEAKQAVHRTPSLDRRFLARYLRESQLFRLRAALAPPPSPVRIETPERTEATAQAVTESTVTVFPENLPQTPPESPPDSSSPVATSTTVPPVETPAPNPPVSPPPARGILGIGLGRAARRIWQLGRMRR